MAVYQPWHEGMPGQFQHPPRADGTRLAPGQHGRDAIAANGDSVVFQHRPPGQDRHYPARVNQGVSGLYLRVHGLGFHGWDLVKKSPICRVGHGAGGSVAQYNRKFPDTARVAPKYCKNMVI
jgi:hypothetical protein